ncbi:hypothetical protein AA0112_g8919 [Alternaria arborescens]|uniref:hypothetical protein n=1 Tax=Alternaria arborescens TaxID=156630 RepID=UPI001074F6DF|nr:hypothetical protein AA0111_g11073 [Alternaria arborescens]RYN24490.1 hypothetical protein AA0112_g8919 [Alternaria arborescens]RYO17503.1 hypothetical protein AA0111_g11073 [Alternaria arborescens]
MVVLTALCVTLTLLWAATLHAVSTNLVLCFEYGVHIGMHLSLLERAFVREQLEFLRVYPPVIGTWVGFRFWYWLSHWNDEVAPLDSDNGHEKVHPEEGIDEAEDSVINSIVRDDEAEENNRRGEEEVDSSANEPGVFERWINEDPNHEMLTDNGSKVSHNNEVEDIVIDANAGPQTLTVTVAAAVTVYIKVRVEAAGGNDDMM